MATLLFAIYLLRFAICQLDNHSETDCICHVPDEASNVTNLFFLMMQIVMRGSVTNWVVWGDLCGRAPATSPVI